MTDKDTMEPASDLCINCRGPGDAGGVEITFKGHGEVSIRVCSECVRLFKALPGALDVKANRGEAIEDRIAELVYRSFLIHCETRGSA